MLLLKNEYRSEMSKSSGTEFTLTALYGLLTKNGEQVSGNESCCSKMIGKQYSPKMVKRVRTNAHPRTRGITGGFVAQFLTARALDAQQSAML